MPRADLEEAMTASIVPCTSSGTVQTGKRPHPAQAPMGDDPSKVSNRRMSTRVHLVRGVLAHTYWLIHTQRNKTTHEGGEEDVVIGGTAPTETTNSENPGQAAERPSPAHMEAD